jgi:cysteinyl-tRNA synthetase
MTPHIPVKSTDEAIDSAELGEKILERQAQVAEPIERQYKQMGGPDVGKHLPENQTVSAEQASFDLTLARQQEAEAIARAEQQELARTIDEMRGEQQPPDPQQVAEATEKLRTEHPNAFPSQAQPEQTPQADDEVAKALQNPKVLAAVQEYAAQANQRADQIAQYYTQAIQQNAEAAAAAITVQWPELRGLNTQEQFRTAIQTVAATNPERARAMVQHIEQTKAVIQEQQRARQDTIRQSGNALGFILTTPHRPPTMSMNCGLKKAWARVRQKRLRRKLSPCSARQ